MNRQTCVVVTVWYCPLKGYTQFMKDIF